MNHRIFDNLVITKEEFRLNSVLSGLDITKKITDQNGVLLTYRDKEGIKKVPAKHGVITMFLINGTYYLLGIPMKNPEANTLELQASIGGKDKARDSLSMRESLNKEIKENTNEKLDISSFEIASSYVCHRVPDWGEWSVCFMKVVALSKDYSIMAELKNLITSINKGYGIYELDEIFIAAKNTAGMEESPNKPQSKITNYYTGLKESWVICEVAVT